MFIELLAKVGYPAVATKEVFKTLPILNIILNTNKIEYIVEIPEDNQQNEGYSFRIHTNFNTYYIQDSKADLLLKLPMWKLIEDEKDIEL